MTSELTLWRGHTVPVLSGEISRYNVSDYMRWIQQNQYGMYQPIPIQTTYGRQAQEPIANNFAGFVEGLLYASGPVASVQAYRLRVFGQAPLLFQETVDGRPGDFFDDERLSLIRSPWPAGTESDLMKRSLIHGDMGGNAYGAVIDGEIVLLRPDWVKIVLEKRMYQGVQVGWRQVGLAYAENGYFAEVDFRSPEIATFLPGEYFHFVPGLPDPLATYRGMSWLTPIVREVMADKAATEHKLKFFENAATANLVVKTPAQMTPKQFKDFVANMRDQHEGVQGAYKTLYLGDGADATVIGANMQQMDFAAVQGKGETRVANAGGVPPVLLSFSEGMQGSSLNAGNYQAAKRSFVDTTMRDLWQNWCGSLQALEALRPEPQTRIWYDHRDIPFLHEDQQDAANIRQINASTIASYIQSGFTPDSSVLAVTRDDPTVLEHTGLTSVQLLPPGESGEEEPTEDVEDDEFDAEDEETVRAALWELEDVEEIQRDAAFERLHKRGRGGKFTNMFDALTAWARTGEQGDPLRDFERPTLLKGAKDLGLTPRRGISDDDLRESIYREVRERVANARELRVSEPKKATTRKASPAAVAKVASAFHEDWRKTRLREDGSFEPRVKATKDKRWISAHGTDQVDIANTSYDDLPSDWQAENKAAAEVVVGILNRRGSVDLDDEQVRQEVGEEIHQAWLDRNEWAKGGDLDVPFSELPADEQAKDLDQITVAMRVAPRKAAAKATAARKPRELDPGERYFADDAVKRFEISGETPESIAENSHEGYSAAQVRRMLRERGVDLKNGRGSKSGNPATAAKAVSPRASKPAGLPDGWSMQRRETAGAEKYDVKDAEGKTRLIVAASVVEGRGPDGLPNGKRTTRFTAFEPGKPEVGESFSTRQLAMKSGLERIGQGSAAKATAGRKAATPRVPKEPRAPKPAAKIDGHFSMGDPEVNSRLAGELAARPPAEIRRVGREVGVSVPTGMTDRAEMAKHIIHSMRAFGTGRDDEMTEQGLRDALSSIDAGKGPGDIDAVEAKVRQALANGGGEDAFIRAIASDPGMTSAKTRKLAERLGIDLPTDVKHKGSLQAELALRLHRRGSARPSSPVEVDSPAGRVSAARTDVTSALGRFTPTAERQWAAMADLRDELGDGHDRADVDKAIKELVASGQIELIPVANLKSLSKRDRDAAISIGGEQQHAIRLKPKAGGAGPKAGSAGQDFDARVKGARKGRAATGATTYRYSPVATANADVFPDVEQRRAIADALGNYQVTGYRDINRRLRAGDTTSHRAIPLIDAAMERSPLAHDVVVWRGVRSGESAFGPRASWPDDLTGQTWTDPAYFSSSVQEATGEKFARAKTVGGQPGVLMRIVAPKGTPAVAIRPAQRYAPNEYEILFGRGQTYRVVADHGPDADGIRRLDVEVVPVGGPKAGRPARVGDLTAAQNLRLVDANGVQISDRDRPPSAQFVEVTKVDGNGQPVEGKVLSPAEIQKRRAPELKALRDDTELQGRVTSARKATQARRDLDSHAQRFRTGRDNGMTPAEADAFAASGMSLDEWRRTRPKPRASQQAVDPEGRGPEGLSTDPAVREVQVENRVRAAYASLHNDQLHGGWVGIADLRDRIGEDVPRADVDAALERLLRDRGAKVAASEFQSTFAWTGRKEPLTDRDRVAALHIAEGAAPRHMISFRRDGQMADLSPRPLPSNPTPRSEVPTTVQGNFGAASRIRETQSISAARRQLENLSDEQLDEIALGGDIYIGAPIDPDTPREQKIDRIVQGIMGYRMTQDVQWVRRRTGGEYDVAIAAADREVPGLGRGQETGPGFGHPRTTPPTPQEFQALVAWLNAFAAEARKRGLSLPPSGVNPGQIIIPKP